MLNEHRRCFNLLKRLNNDKSAAKVHGGSMRPFLRDGDIVITKKVDPKDMASGDIILYHLREKFCVHRIIRKSKKNDKTVFFTKGDRLSHFDAPVYDKQIMGKVIAVKKKNKIINLTSKKGQMLNLLLLVYSISALYMRNFLPNDFLRLFRKKVN